MDVASTADDEISLFCTWALTVTHVACDYTEEKFNAEKTGGDPGQKKNQRRKGEERPTKETHQIVKHAKIVGEEEWWEESQKKELEREGEEREGLTKEAKMRKFKGGGGGKRARRRRGQRGKEKRDREKDLPKRQKHEN
ncbi:hypothetical protein BDR03DRAFT_982855 [Suillus americanus]|nr:hypothetical protein BDR03DRAFT_982855 [Suillus americanus]